MSSFFRNIGVAVFILVIGLVVGYFVSRRYFPRILAETVIQYRDRPIARRDSSTTTRPTTRIIYERVPYALPPDTVYLPPLKNFRVVGVISPTPIKVEPGQVTLTYYSIPDSAFVQNRYKIRRPVWGYSLSAFTEIGVFNTDTVHAFGLLGTLRYKATSLYLSAASGAAGTSYATFGIRYRFAGKE